jgi:hypothetical protein
VPNGKFKPEFVTIPVRGIVSDETGFVLEALESLDWAVVGPDHFDELGRASSRTSSLRGNLDHIWERLRPDALLLVRCFEHERQTVWDEYRADTVLSVLNLALLLNGHQCKELECEDWPRYLFRVRYREYCDLPLTFDMEGTRSVGHSGRLGLLSPAVRVPMNLLEMNALIDASPPVLKKILLRKPLTTRERRLKEAAIHIVQAFDTVSTGAFVSHLIGMGEMLVDPPQDGATNGGQWKRRLNRMKILMRENADIVERVTCVRHGYVHAGKQPENDLPAFNALAFAVETWAVIAEMYDIHENSKEVNRILDCVAISRESSIAELASISSLVPVGPSQQVQWISKYLTI